MCRIAYELMQGEYFGMDKVIEETVEHHGDAGDRINSVDGVYHFDGQLRSDEFPDNMNNKNGAVDERKKTQNS